MNNYNDILDEQIKKAKQVIAHERYNLSLLEKEKANQKQGIEKWIGHVFESSSQTTPEFLVFYNEAKKYIKQLIGADYKLKQLANGAIFYHPMLDIRAMAGITAC
jgi:hypothetical protein